MRKVRTKLVAALCLYAGTAVICPLLAKASANNVDVQQQDNVCKGLVVDQKGEPIIGASVVIKGTPKGTVTDFDGKFSISNAPNGCTIVVSYIGYLNQEKKWDGNAIKIVLNEDSKALDEVVVVGYGTQKKANLTGAVASVNGDVLENRPISNIGQGLQGVVPNLNVSMSRGGAPGANSTFNVRGTTSLNGGEPLVLVDNVQMDPNLVNPDDICEEYGADCLRLYEMFLGPLEQSKPWNTQGLSGVYGFLKKFYNLYFDGDTFSVSEEEPTKEELKILHTLIKKVIYDIENFSFNTSVSQFMIAVNELQKLKCNKKAILEPLAVLISPYAPHVCEELWSLLGNAESIDFAPFPALNEAYLVEDEIEYPVSFNGKMRFKLSLSAELSKEEIEEIVMKDEKVIQQLDGAKPKKIIVVPKKIINIVS